AHEAVYRIAAAPEEGEALARRFDLLSLDRLEGEIRLQRLDGGFVRLRGRLGADVVQACVISLEPVASVLERDFAVLYGSTESGKSVIVDLETDEAEPFDGGAIDIGEAGAHNRAVGPEPHARGAGGD